MDLAALKESLSRPTPAAIDALRALTGDLIVLGAGGKMGPSLARMAARGFAEIGSDQRVVAVARFSDAKVREEIEAAGIHTVAADLLDRAAVEALPDAGAVAFLVGTKFGTSAGAARTWALNAWLPGLVAERYPGVPIVVFSSGNVYPFVPVDSGGATEQTPVDPIGEYAQSVVARERVFEHFSRERGTKTAIYRLNYAAELRYGVPVDIALRVFGDEPIDLTMGHCNVIWQGDANAMALACFSAAAVPPGIVNVTGRETLSVRELALRFGEAFGKEPKFTGTERDTALLSDASRAIEQFGPLTVSIDQMIEWIAEWITRGGATHGKPTHFEVRDGAF